MTTSLSLVVTLLTTALSLLTLVQQNPDITQSSRDTARQVAETAIAQATMALNESTHTVGIQETKQVQATTSVVENMTTASSTPEIVPTPTVKVTAKPSDVEYDGTSNISWIATDALSCTLGSSPVLLDIKGSQLVAPKSSNWKEKNKITYTVNCTGPGGSVSGDTTVTVQPWEPPEGYRVLPADQCNTSTVGKCITGPGGWSCNNVNGRSCGG